MAPTLRRVIYLEDNDIVHMKGGEYTVYNWSDVDSPSVEVRRTIQTLTLEVSQIMKGGYNHFMEKEIFEQAETVAQTMQGRVKMTPLSPMKYAVPGIDPYLMPRVRLGGLVDHIPVSGGWWRAAGCRNGVRFAMLLCLCASASALAALPSAPPASC